MSLGDKDKKNVMDEKKTIIIFSSPLNTKVGCHAFMDKEDKSKNFYDKIIYRQTKGNK